MIRLFAPLAIVACLSGGAFAQVAVLSTENVNPNSLSTTDFNPDDAVSPVSIVQGPGVKIGEGTVLRPVFGVETGVTSNIFYANQNADGAGLLRLLAQIGISSLGQARLSSSTQTSDAIAATDGDDLNQGSLVYSASLRAAYDFTLSNDNQASKVNGLGIGASFHGLTNPMGTFSLGLDEDFQRLIRAADFETDADLNRDINSARLVMMIHPKGRTVSGYLYYLNTVDAFEQTTAFTNRMANRFGVHPIWQWLPQTRVFLDLSFGSMTAIGSGPKSTSYPLVAAAGLTSLLTVKTTLSLMAGYTNGFYQQGPSFSAPVAGVDIGYRYSPLGRVMLGYRLQYNDSINANFYRDHVIMASLQQLFDPFAIIIQPELHFREYNGISVTQPQVMGPDTRDDVIFALVAGLAYNYRNWLAVTLDYRFQTVQTDYRYMSNGMTVDPSYTRHDVMLGVRMAL
jgi:hypothetical protein